jgi:hypothetical protein
MTIFINNDINLSSNCFIDSAGNIIPVESGGHIQKFDYLRENGLIQYESEITLEQAWVKISSCLGSTLILFHGTHMTGKQKITLSKIIKHLKLLPNDGDDMLLSYKGHIAINSNGTIKITKLKE